MYQVIANYQKGINIWDSRGENKKQVLFNTFISGVLAVIIFAVLSGNYQLNHLALYFISFVAFLFATRMIMMSLNHKKQERIEKELNEEDK